MSELKETLKRRRKTKRKRKAKPNTITEMDKLLLAAALSFAAKLIPPEVCSIMKQLETAAPVRKIRHVNLTSLPDELYYITAAKSFGEAAIHHINYDNSLLSIYYATAAASYYLDLQQIKENVIR